MDKLDNEANTKIDELRKKINSLKEAESTSQSNSADYISSLKRQNEELTKENKELQERINNLSYILADLNTKVKDTENENMSLIA